MSGERPRIIDFNGRLSAAGFRRLYHRSSLYSLLAIAAAAFAFFAVALTVGQRHPVASTSILIVPVAVFLVLLVASLSQWVRRLHDHGISGFWVPVHVMAPILIGGGAYWASGLPHIGWISDLLLAVAVITFVATIGWNFYIQLARGQFQANRYGPTPLD